MSAELTDAIVSQAIQELEAQRASAFSHADQVFNRSKSAIEALRIAAERDVFKDALVVAVGDFIVGEVQPGVRICTRMYGGSLDLTVVKSKITREESDQRAKAFCEERRAAGAGSFSIEPKLRAMLVIFEEKAPIGGSS